MHGDNGPPPLIVIGGSAGSLRPLRQIIAGLPADLKASVSVAIHLPKRSPSALATVIANVGELPAAFAEDGVPVAPGTIQVAPPGHQLLVQGDQFVLSRGALENLSRPAIDPLFCSAAKHHGPRVISVLLSGTLDDGTAGTVAVAIAGGITIVEDPEDAQFPDMPSNALASGAVHYVLPARRIPMLLEDLVASINWFEGERPPEVMAGDMLRADDPIDRALDRGATDREAPASPYSCPACGGVLYTRDPPLQYLCRLGHRYSPESLAHDQETIADDTLRAALRTLEEESSLASEVRDRAAARGDRGMEVRFEARRAGAVARADRIRALFRGATTKQDRDMRLWPDSRYVDEPSEESLEHPEDAAGAAANGEWEASGNGERHGPPRVAAGKGTGGT